MADIEPDLHEADRRLFRLISDGATCQHVPGTGTDRLVTVVVHGDWDHGRVQQLRVHGHLPCCTDAAGIERHQRLSGKLGVEKAEQT